LTNEISPAWGPFLFDTSAESWLQRHAGEAKAQQWLDAYLARHEMHLSAITVLERVRGYSRVARFAERDAYLNNVGRIWPVDAGVAVVAAELMALLPEPPSPPKRSHRLAESRAGRLSRWRFDLLLAATSAVTGLPLIHDNAADFEAARSVMERQPDRFPGVGSLGLIRVGRLLD